MPGYDAEKNFTKEELETLEAGKFTPPPVTIHDARVLQASYSSPAECFKKHGFCLLNHKTNVKEWNADWRNKDNDITKFY
jgi:hypothetical protein